jgi:hypothetical protein
MEAVRHTGETLCWGMHSLLRLALTALGPDFLQCLGLQAWELPAPLGLPHT